MKLSDAETIKLLKKWKIPVADSFMAKTEAQAVTHSKKLGYPVVMKISSSDISHKSDSGGVIINIKNDVDAIKAYNKIITNAKKITKKIDGVLVQKMVSGTELIVGSKIDPQFGPVILFGLGGVFVELMKDVSIRLIPIEKKDAIEMISEIKGFEILRGARGRKPVDLVAIEKCLLNVSKMIEKNPKITEFDINPLFASEKGVIAGDFRVFTQ